MVKIIQKYLDIKLVKISLIFTLIYSLLFNSSVFIYKYEHYNVSFFRTILELSKDFLYLYIFLFICFFGLAINRLLFIAGSLLLFLSGALASYYLYFFKTIPTYEVIAALFSAEFNEAYEMVSIRLIIWLLFSLFICLYTIKHFGMSEGKSFVTKLVSAICLLIFINNIIAPQYKLLNTYFPLQYLHNSYIVFFGNKERKRVNIAKEYQFADNSKDDIIIVLVIGESARYDHFELNGYDRGTNPDLKKISNLFSFKAKAASNSTYVSVPCLLSRYSKNNMPEMNKETGLSSIFTELGFNTNWVGSQSLMKYFRRLGNDTIYEEVNFAIIPGGSALFKMNDLDIVLLPYAKKIIEQNGKQFLVLHTSGSHWDYKERYSEDFGKFTPGCKSLAKSDPSTCDIEGLINNYDNSILYTDFFLSNLIDLLKDKNSFLIYVSDHGESLGEEGRFCHGGEMTKEQSTIPFIVWFSDKFQQENPEIKKNLKQYLDKEISHDYVFHSMLDCAGISSNIIDKGLSLCRNLK